MQLTVRSCRSCVDRVDLCHVPRGDVFALDLHGRGEHAVLHGPLVRDEDELLRNLKGSKAVPFALGLEVREHCGHDLLALAHSLHRVALDAKAGCERLEVGHLRADEGDAVALGGMRVDKGNGGILGALEHVLHLGKRHILALLELDEILLAVDELDSALRRELANITRAEVPDAADGHEVALVAPHAIPLCLRLLAGRVERRQGTLPRRRDVIAVGHRGTANENLAPGHANLGLVLVAAVVVALRPVAEAHAGVLLGRAAVPGGAVMRRGDGRGRARLGKSVALAQGAIEARLHEHLHLGREGRGSREHDAHAPAEELLDLGEDHLLVEPRRADDILFEVALASLA
mmetsp:Transcript_1298/g.3122  ORF Transcript_1298/g.3122 Transcript_1298/m.3122 type:complete len:347 (-) Transcript_1298:8-1048(-)